MGNNVELCQIVVPSIKMRACMLSRFSCVCLCGTLWTEAVRLLCPWDSTGKNTGMCCCVLLQGIFLTQGSNPHFFMSLALAGGFFTTSTTWEAQH